MDELKQEEIFWNDLSGEERRFLRQSGSYIPFSPGEMIFKKGDASDGVYIIVSGEVEILDYDEKGNAIPIRTLGSGTVLGEIATFSTSTRTATARAKTTGILFKINKEVIDGLINNCPNAMSKIIHNILHLMSQRIIQLTKEVGELKAARDTKE